MTFFAAIELAVALVPIGMKWFSAAELPFLFYSFFSIIFLQSSLSCALLQLSVGVILHIYTTLFHDLIAHT